MRLIDADEIRKKAVPHTRGDFGRYNSDIRKWAVLVGDIDDAPTVDAVPVVHGHWIDGYAVDGTGKKVYDSIDCSVCEDIFKIESHDREYWKTRFKSCPFCGALMDEVDEDA